MQFDQVQNAYILEESEAATLNASGGSVWPVDDGSVLLEIVDERISRCAGLDVSEFPAGSYRNHLVGQNLSNLRTLERIRSQLVPYVIGLEAEEFLRGTTR